MIQRITKRQNAILTYIRAFVAGHGFPPSIRQIGVAVGLSSSSTVHSHLKTLEAKGYIRRHRSHPRSIQLVDVSQALVVVGPYQTPLQTASVGRLRALEEVARLARLYLQGKLPSPDDLDLALDFAEQARCEEGVADAA